MIPTIGWWSVCDLTSMAPSISMAGPPVVVESLWSMTSVAANCAAICARAVNSMGQGSGTAVSVFFYLCAQTIPLMVPDGTC